MDKKKTGPNFISAVGLLLAGVMYTSIFLISSMRAFYFGFPNLAYASLLLASFGVVMMGLGARRFLRWWRYQPVGTGPVQSMEDWKKEHE